MYRMDDISPASIPALAGRAARADVLCQKTSLMDRQIVTAVLRPLWGEGRGV